MTYNEFIQNIIDTRGQWNIPEGEYYENHHIIPRCLGGEPIEYTHTTKHENLIWLLPQEHYQAHKLLTEKYSDNYHILYAFSMMVNCTNATTNERNYLISEDEYAIAKKYNAIASSEKWKGKGNPMYDVHRFGESNPNYGKKHPGLNTGEKNGMYGKHFSHSNETKKLMSQQHYKYWKNISDDDYLKRCEKVSGEHNGMYGRSGKLSPRSKPVYCIELNQVFASVTEAMNITKIDKKCIRDSCNTGVPDKFNNHWRWQN